MRWGIFSFDQFVYPCALYTWKTVVLRMRLVSYRTYSLWVAITYIYYNLYLYILFHMDKE